MNYYLGVDIGSTTLKTVMIDENHTIVYKHSVPHYGKIISLYTKEIQMLYQKYDTNIRVMFTGVNAKAIVQEECYLIGDIPAIHKGASILCRTAQSIIEIGSQNARYLTQLQKGDMPLFAVNENCAGGTGAFFEDQMYRLGLKITDYSQLVENAKFVPRLSGRCSVFAKTDIIHRQQEGVGTADILLGLCYATIRNFKATVIRNLPIETPIALCGGVVNNKGVIRAIKEVFELNDEQFIAHTDHTWIQAAGAALVAMESGMNVQQCLQKSKEIVNQEKEIYGVTRLQVPNLIKNIKVTEPMKHSFSGTIRVTLGVDVGSTSTNLVLLSEDGKVVDYLYLRTKGEPETVVKDGMKQLKKKYGDKIQITSIGVTGSGRNLIGKMLQAKTVVDEITAQAMSAITLDNEVDTVFEIGGQDSKYIHIEQGLVSDFQMNKICAAGTGSFIEEQAGRLNVALNDYGELALRSNAPVDLGERCTVFIESNIGACMAKGVAIPDILMGLCHSVIRNYLVKVVAGKPVGKRIMLQGGVCYNPAVIAAFQAEYGDRIVVSPYFSVSGAMGAAILAAKEEKIAEAKQLSNHAYAYDKAREYFFDGYERKIVPHKKTIGIPYVLLVHKLFPMFRTYFTELGFQVLLSPDTNEEIIALSQTYAQAETCYPVKLIYGHIAYLANQKVDYIFLPHIVTMKHENSKVHHNYGCVYMQTASKMIYDSMKLKQKGIELLAPTFSLDFGKKAMISAMVHVGVQLGKAKPVCAVALMKGAMAVRKHTDLVEQLGKDMLSQIQPDEKVLVIVTRTYGVDDPVLNMGIAKELLKRGYKVITLSHLPAHDLDLSKEYENLYWPFGQHIISGIKMIANHPNLYAVYLTNHGCGPDTMLSHLVKKEMGEKPFLQIEVDEHFSKVGVITRIEAFLNSLKSQKNIDVSGNDYFSNLHIKSVRMSHTFDRAKKIYIPYLYPFSTLFVAWLKKEGYDAEEMQPSNRDSYQVGRQYTTTKEYASFTALLGDVMITANRTTQESQIYIPQTEGSEADGMYARVIREYLPDHITIVTNHVEALIKEKRKSDQAFFLALYGDMIMTTPADIRAELLGYVIQEGIYKKNLNHEFLIQLAWKIQNLQSVTKRKIAVLGELFVVYNSFLHEEMIEELEKEGIYISRMPLSEYLCYMWETCKQSKKEIETLKYYKKTIQEISIILGENTPFSPEVFDIEGIAMAGGNGEYRHRKHTALKQVCGIIEMASMYENTQTILEITGNENPIPALTLSFEGTNDSSNRDKLKSFLYYI